MKKDTEILSFSIRETDGQHSITKVNSKAKEHNDE